VGFLRHNFYPARIFMGDSGALLLGFTLATVSVQGLLKTAVLASLVLPLLVLAVPLIDTSFVVAKRLKHGQPIYVADRAHLHYRFENIGFSQPRAVAYLYGWCLTLALAAFATHFVHPHRHGHWDAVNVAIDAAVALLALGASVYVIYLLEIVKLANPFIRRRAVLARTEAERRSA
jgi:UDP-GlcNAc:undecaprenyl-phosphate GlcNAc-1-phosphate transferase